MESIPIIVKHQGKKHEIEVDPASSGEVFKTQLYSMTNVEPERQKIIIKGGQLKDDAIMGDIGLKPGQTIMMMGTASDATGDMKRPEKPVKFLEDMTEAEAAAQEGATPAGLNNLGNTCYLNSSLQVLRSMPELTDALTQYKPPPPVASPLPDLSNQLGKLYTMMSKTQDSISPVSFLSALRVMFPQFAERAKNHNGFAQQDAEEAWSQIVSSLNQNLKGEGGLPFVNQYMAGKFKSVLECDEQAAKDGGEEPVTSSETFFKLNCHIDGTINHLRDGIVAGLSEKLEKKSEVLDRDAVYTKKSEITELPRYLAVHFVRFFWKRDTSKKAKIMRKVTFPHELDIVEFCEPELREMLVPIRDKVREIRKDEIDIERARKRRKKAHEAEAAAGSSTKPAPSKGDKKGGKKGGKDEDTEMAETFKTDAEVEAERDAALATAKSELAEIVKPYIAERPTSNQTGLYELRGVITHQGASADSGHYTAYVKKSASADAKTGEKKKAEEDDKWWWFNDDKVSEVTADKIEALAGGGESHSALILLYRAVPLPYLEQSHGGAE